MRLAQEALDALGLEQVRFIPSGIPPHRDLPNANPAQRLAMLQLACAENAAFTVDARETLQAQASYTVDTLSALRTEYGAQRPLCLLLGADAFLGLSTWRRWLDLFSLAHIAVAQRPGFPQATWLDNMPSDLQRILRERGTTQVEQLWHAPAGHIFIFTITALDIAATRIRKSLGEGRSPRYLLPEAVLNYIFANRLYAHDA